MEVGAHDGQVMLPSLLHSRQHIGRGQPEMSGQIIGKPLHAFAKYRNCVVKSSYGAVCRA